MVRYFVANYPIVILGILLKVSLTMHIHRRFEWIVRYNKVHPALTYISITYGESSMYEVNNCRLF
jgi:hypothetical protein